MAVKLSAYLWLRNNDLLPYSKGEYETGRRLTLEEREELKKIIEEIDELHKCRDEGQHGPLISIENHVMLSGYREVIERSYEPERSGQLFTQIHQILKDKFVNIDIYCHLGRAFKELGLEPSDPDLKVAIDYATREFERYKSPWERRVETMCAEVIIERSKTPNKEQRF